MGGKIKTHKGPNKPQPTFLSYFSGFHSGGACFFQDRGQAGCGQVTGREGGDLPLAPKV